MKDKGAFLNKDLFLQALIDNMESRLEGTVASGSRLESDKTLLKELLRQIDCLEPAKWPSGVESPWLEGEAQIKKLCVSAHPFQTSFLQILEILTTLV